MFALLSVEFTVFTAWGYAMSLIELVATLFGIASVFLASRANIATWPVGIINQWSFFALFWQVQLYSVALLQILFFAMALYGWWQWKFSANSGDTEDIRPKSLSTRGWVCSVLALMTAWLMWGTVMNNIHHWLPSFFPEAAAYAYLDSLITVASVIAIILMANKIVQCWLFWIFVNTLSVVMYALQDVFLVAIEYVIFWVLALYGYVHWRKLSYSPL